MNRQEEKPDIKPTRKGFVANYPPFRQWKEAAVDDMVASGPINIYIHFPFCIQRCAYCYYKTTKLKESQLSGIDKYVGTVCREIELATKRFHLSERTLASIYFGGGTPTLMSNDNWHRIFKCLQENLNIVQPEFTVEAEPVTLTQKKAGILKEIGVNRISLGIQSFCEEIVRLAGRKDTEKLALKAIDTAKATGAVINIDLLSGLAGETPKTWAYSIKRALSVDVESITIYKMELYPNTKYFFDIRKKLLELPSEEQELEFIRYALEQFEQAQYLPWSFFTFTKMGRYVHTHSPSVWRGNDCYGFGASAFGSLGDWLFQNTNDLERYFTTLKANKLPLNRGHHLTSLERMIRNVALEMKLVSLDLNEFQKRHGFKLESLCYSTIKQLDLEGFVSLSKNQIELTQKGILYGDYVGKRLTRSLMEMC
jgi:oxygen-independent coproporphyrinogen-3 oxidase